MSQRVLVPAFVDFSRERSEGVKPRRAKVRSGKVLAGVWQWRTSGQWLAACVTTRQGTSARRVCRSVGYDVGGKSERVAVNS